MATSEDEQIKQVVLDFLQTADMSTTTERKVLAHVQASLPLSKPAAEYKRLVSDTIDQFLTSLPDEDNGEADDGGEDVEYEPESEAAAPPTGGRKRSAAGAGAASGGAAAKKSRGGGGGGDDVLFSRDLSGRRKARVRRYEGKLYVDVREFWNSPEGEAPTQKGLSMDPGQWARLAHQLPRLLEAQRAGEPAAAPAQLGRNRMAAVSEFKGVHYIGLREYYEKDGQLLPGKKGVSLNPAEASLLLEAAPEISAAAGSPAEPPPLEPAAAALPARAAAAGAGVAGTSGRGDADAAGRGGGEEGAEGDRDYVDLGGSKRVSISRFGGRLSVDLREWYERDGTMHPGKKGIALSTDDWAALAAAVGDISSALSRKDRQYALQLSGKRRVSLSEFKGVYYVAVREYYDKGGELAPGQKGLNMNPQQWAALAAGVPVLEAALRRAQEGGV